jgi:hypothetical protein
MDVYRKPYGQSAPTMRNLNGNCAYMLRFGPDIQHVYFIDNGPTLSPRNGRPNDSDSHISQRTTRAATATQNTETPCSPPGSPRSRMSCRTRAAVLLEIVTNPG